MKNITSNYKNAMKLMGREIDSIISYEDNDELIELGAEQLNSVTPVYKSSILKSAMKELDIDSNVEIPIGTILTYQFGLKVGNEYEYINYGNYVVYKAEKQEDTKSWNIVCYDKMLYAMKDYESLGVTYPITVRDYLSAICTKIGLTLATNTFANHDKEIQTELYLDSNGNSLGYTYRDVLDEIAQVTASTICINNNDELEVRYITDTEDTIDEEYLKDINVNFGEKYGPVNSIVLSRAGDSDKVYLRDDESIALNGLCEINISENQIMNFNDRSDYLPAILNKLDGLEYYLNDFSSTGITYYELCDRYNVVVENNTYSCVMFNDEILVTQGLVENVFTEMPEDSETDYTKADKTDRKINQTTLIVDKQNQVIQSTVNTVTEQNNKISQITQTVDEINQKISDIADVTVSGESNIGDVVLENVNASEPITIKIRPLNSSNNISYLYPNSNLYPSSTTYLKTRKIRFIRTYEEEGQTLTENIDYELPDDLLYYDSTHYDEFYLSHDSETCQITKRCKYNADGTIGLLTQEEVNTYTYPSIVLGDGDYEVQLLGYDIGYLYVQLMASNIYTTQFATKVEMNSAINQKADEISLEVEEKLDSDEFTHAKIVAKINDDTSQVQIEADKIDLQGYITATDLAGTGTTTINGSNITTGSINANLITSGTLSANRISGGHLEIIGNYTEGNAFVDIISPNSTTSRPIGTSIWNNGLSCFDYSQGSSIPVIRTENDNGYAELAGHVVNAYGFNNISLEERKKNFEKLNNALSIIKDIDIYKYNYKNERDDDKKHIGLVIGENYNYSKEVTSNNNEEVDIYSLVSVCCQAIKELQKEINELKKESEK